MSSQAGPSSSRNTNGSSKRAKAAEPVASSRSQEIIESDEDASSSEEDPDSEGDLEDVQPKRRAAQPEMNGAARVTGAGWP